MTSPQPAPSARPWVGVALLVPAALVVALSAVIVYSFTTDYVSLTGHVVSGALQLAPLVGGISLVVVPLTWFGLRLGWPDLVRGRALRVLGGSVATVTILILGSGALGAMAHDRAVARSESACSVDELAAFDELGALAGDSAGFGDRDGSCHAILAGRGGDEAAKQAAVADVRGRLGAHGWQPTGSVTDAPTTYARDGRTIVITVSDDGKAVEVKASFPPD